MTAPEFPSPLRATHHCRHYSYQHGNLLAETGPTCGLGIDLSEPGASSCCWPSAEKPCGNRQEYTDQEREVWKAWVSESWKRLDCAISALPAPLRLGATGTIECPNCGGALRYGRWHRGAMVQCATDGCCAVRVNLAAGADWPAPRSGSAA